MNVLDLENLEVYDYVVSTYIYMLIKESEGSFLPGLFVEKPTAH